MARRKKEEASKSGKGEFATVNVFSVDYLIRTYNKEGKVTHTSAPKHRTIGIDGESGAVGAFLSELEGIGKDQAVEVTAIVNGPAGVTI